MVGAGIGVTLIPRMAVMIETRNAESVAQLKSPRPTRTIGLVWRKTNPLSGQFETLAAMVRDAQAPDPQSRFPLFPALPSVVRALRSCRPAGATPDALS